MKTLKFAQNLVSLVLSGQKTSTWRLFDDKDLKIGDKLIFVSQKTGVQFAQAKIIGLKEKKLGEINEADFESHEKYQNQEEMLRTYQNYYPNGKIDENTAIKIIDFKLL